MSVELAELAAAVISGGVIQAILAHLLARKSATRVDFTLILNTIHRENMELKAQNAELLEKVSALQAEVQRLHEKIFLMSTMAGRNNE